MTAMRKPASERQRCCVPFCERTRKDDGKFSEWLCAEHWRVVPADLKAAKRRVERDIRSLRRRGLWRVDAFESNRDVWTRCKAAAIEAAGGLK